MVKNIDDLRVSDFSNKVFDYVIQIECKHLFHLDCIEQCVNNNHIQCPNCKKIYGIKLGDQPDGQMVVSSNKQLKCSGYENCGTITIQYNMKSGIRNGINFSGTNRVAYLPDNHQGQEILALLKIAFDRKLIFTVGRSVTTGSDNQIVWAGIHHKTNTHGGTSKFGYPDPTYFNRVKEELASRGVNQ